MHLHPHLSPKILTRLAHLGQGVRHGLWHARFVLSFVLVLAVLGTALVCVVSGGIADVTAPYILSPDGLGTLPDGERFDCVLILGAGLRPDGSPSDMLADRVRIGCAVYLSAPARFGALLLTQRSEVFHPLHIQLHNFMPLILSHRRFMYYVLTQAFGMGVLFTYIAASPFILQQHYGLSPIGYSVCFATNAAGIIVGSWLAGRFRRGSNALSAGLWGLVGSGVLCATTLLCGLPFGFLESTLFLLMVAIGMILPTSTALALDIEREHSGSASAVIGFFQFLSGAIVSPLTGLGDILLLTGLLTVCCSVVSLCFGALACRPSRN